MCHGCFRSHPWTHTHTQSCDTHASIFHPSSLTKAFACCFWIPLTCVWSVSLFFFPSSVTESEWHVHYSFSVPPHTTSPSPSHEPTGKMASKGPHQVLLLCLDIHLGNSSRAIILASSWANSSIYSCWIFLWLLRLFIVNTVVCVVPRARPPTTTMEMMCIPYQIRAVCCENEAV